MTGIDQLNDGLSPTIDGAAAVNGVHRVAKHFGQVVALADINPVELENQFLARVGLKRIRKVRVSHIDSPVVLSALARVVAADVDVRPDTWVKTQLLEKAANLRHDDELAACEDRVTDYAGWPAR